MTDNSDKQLRQQLNRPLPPQDLTKNIRANWQQQLLQQRQQRPLLALVASLLVLVTSAFFYFKSDVEPIGLINAAAKDIDNDARHQIGITLALSEIFQQTHINPPPASMEVQMSKYCFLNNNKTLHLKIAGAKKGYVHLFIKQGDFEAALWQSKDRRKVSMPWRLLKPRNDISVLVLYSQDMDPGGVDSLIQTMFYA